MHFQRSARLPSWFKRSLLLRGWERGKGERKGSEGAGSPLPFTQTPGLAPGSSINQRKSSSLCLDLHISRKSTVIRWILPTDHFGLLSNVVFGLHLEGTPAIPSHQNTRLSCSRPVRPTLCLRDMDSHFSGCQVPGGIPYEMPTQNLENLVEAIRSQLGNVCAHWSTCHQRRHPTSSHRRLWPHRQTAGQHPST